MHRLFFTVLYMTIAVSILNGCALVQWLPSSSCEHVKYERNGEYVEVEASCHL
jgi:hypothetical protein